MKINKIAYTPVSLNMPQKKAAQNNTKTQTSPIEQKNVNLFAYQDYNISFGGRTPEDFYAQDFNRNNMPTTMKNFLDYDYNQRQHIPPEQMMHEVFKYIENTNNFEEVKKLYPNEELFQNLHENKTASRKTILSEIKIAREMGDTPLLKDGSDNFGMYILKKIYSEGKTLKEISKDFLEKDINDEYKGVVSKPIDYQTLSAFGIKFPNIAFWHSFISTREEYKKFFISLPKNMVDPNRISSSKSSTSHSSAGKIRNEEIEKEQAPRPRKFKIQSYKKNQIKNDVKETSGDIEILTKKVTRRFSKDDPEASFIVKYFSPIMTVAANKIHLSEEMKAFNENEKLNGKQSNEKYMLSRFWKANHLLLEEYSNAVPDTIEMFEDIYGGGGNIPINNEFEPITKDTPNQKIIDYVSQEFLDLLNYSKEIEPNRNLKYQEHERLQKEWEEYFKNKDSESETAKEIEDLKNSIQKLGTLLTDISKDLDEMSNDNPKLENNISYDQIDEIAKQHNSEIYNIKCQNGINIKLAANFNEVFKQKLIEEVKSCPKKFVNEYINYMMNLSNSFSEDYKLSIVVDGARKEMEKGDNEQTKEVMNSIIDERVLTKEELFKVDLNRQAKFFAEKLDKEYASSMALSEVLNKYLSKEDCHKSYQLYSTEYIQIPAEETFNAHKDEINALYAKYTTPVTTGEKNKISNTLMKELYTYKGEKKESVISDNTRGILLMLQDSIKTSPERKKIVKDMIMKVMNDSPFMKAILNNDLGDKVQTAKFERSMERIIDTILNCSEKEPSILQLIISPVAFDKYKYELTPSAYNTIKQGYYNLSLRQCALIAKYENMSVNDYKELVQNIFEGN
jgi:hypothetical protein